MCATLQHGCVVSQAPPTLTEVKSQCCHVVALVLLFTWHPCFIVAVWEVCSPAVLQLCPCASTGWSWPVYLRTHHAMPSAGLYQAFDAPGLPLSGLDSPAVTLAVFKCQSMLPQAHLSAHLPCPRCHHVFTRAPLFTCLQGPSAVLWQSGFTQWYANQVPALPCCNIDSPVRVTAIFQGRNMGETVHLLGGQRVLVPPRGG